MHMNALLQKLNLICECDYIDDDDDDDNNISSGTSNSAVAGLWSPEYLFIKSNYLKNFII